MSRLLSVELTENVVYLVVEIVRSRLAHCNLPSPTLTSCLDSTTRRRLDTEEASQ